MSEQDINDNAGNGEAVEEELSPEEAAARAQAKFLAAATKEADARDASVKEEKKVLKHQHKMADGSYDPDDDE